MLTNRGSAIPPGRGPRRGRATAWAGGAALLPILACGPCDGGRPRGEVAGELGNGVFVYRCVDETDAACAGGERPRQFPAAIAVGGAFEVTYDPVDDDLDGAVTVHSPSWLIGQDGSTLTAAAPGQAALAAYLGDELVDVVHVNVVVPELLVFADAAGPLPVDAERTLSVAASDGEGGPAAGAVVYDWSASPDALVDLVVGDSLDQVRVIGAEPGLVRIIAAVGSASTSFEIEVVPADEVETAETGLPEGTGDTGPADTGGEP
jgi:hypothetical protein